MQIDVRDAVYHIINSLDNTNAADWYDSEQGVHWHVSGTEDEITFTFTTDWDDESEQTFKLVPQ